MNDIEAIRKKSSTEWQLLRQPEEPVIFIGTASCGIAAGAQKVKAVIRENLDKHNIKASIVEVGCIGHVILNQLWI